MGYTIGMDGNAQGIRTSLLQRKQAHLGDLGGRHMGAAHHQLLQGLGRNRHRRVRMDGVQQRPMLLLQVGGYLVQVVGRHFGLRVRVLGGVGHDGHALGGRRGAGRRH